MTKLFRKMTKLYRCAPYIFSSGVATALSQRNTRGRSEVREALTEGQPCHPIVAAMLDDMRR